MEVKSIELQLKDKLISLSAATTRADLIAMLGEPDEVEGASDTAKNGTVLVYVDAEFHFLGDAATDKLALIYQEMEIGGERYPEYSIKLK
ncbi:hypothetical protein [Oceanicoccus sp. KOV_DT_Chl]|uniref:hypothetical protein n=1 Tax=Oceanicoccus sp. KOV_DT_Chl TaxID=1904639 RepID=UPI000C7C057F|nr:hypothetical protein [Oceanicoccus sp. KOV_DT_Chl]